ncbi:MAG: hypothetical protein RMY34_32675 [Aulosira sp. DedQUE10]|nr:hypothetical protein [Aulosira sp. DedQUE10]
MFWSDVRRWLRQPLAIASFDHRQIEKQVLLSDAIAPKCQITN